MVRSKDSKLIYSLDGNTICRYCDVQHASETEFYELAKDPDETENVVKNNKSKLLRLKKYGERKAEELKKRKPDSEEKTAYEDEEEVEERLEALGYR